MQRFEESLILHFQTLLWLFPTLIGPESAAVDMKEMLSAHRISWKMTFEGPLKGASHVLLSPLISHYAEFNQAKN